MTRPINHAAACAIAGLLTAATVLGLLTSPLATVAAALAILTADLYRFITTEHPIAETNR